MWAQTVTGSLGGRVSDASGAVLPDAEVELVGEATGARYVGVTNGAGNFQLRSLLPGTYTLRVEKTGFQRVELSPVLVQIGQDRQVAVTLPVGTVTETVEVDATSSSYQQNNAQVGANFTSREITRLPVNLANEGLDRVLLFTPGVVGSFAGGSGNSNGTRISANGASGRSNNFNVDGQDVNEITTTGPAVFTNHADAVAEYQIITRNYSAEFGQATGAVVNVVTKSGTNEVHGALSYFYRNQRLLDTMTNLERRAGLAEAPTEFSQTFGAAAGGPIQKDRLFVFGSYFGIRQPSSQLVVSGPSGLVPTPAGNQTLAGIVDPAMRTLIERASPFNLGAGDPVLQPQVATRMVPVTVNGVTTPVEFGAVQRLISRPFEENQASIRVDYVGNEKWKTFGRYFQQDRVTRNGGGSAAAGFVADIAFEGKQAAQTFVFTPSATMVNESRFHFGRLARKLGGNQLPAFNELDQALTNIATPAGFLNWGPGTNQPDGRVVDTYQFANTLSWQVGSHFLRIGADVRRRVNDLFFLPVVNGQFTFQNWNEFGMNTPRQASVTFGEAGFNILDTQAYFFVQDDWRIRPNLTLNLGLRYEDFGQPINRLHEATVARESSAATALFPGDLPLEARTVPRLASNGKNFSPRLGLVWSPDAATALRVGYGISYDIPFYNILLNMQSSAPVALATSVQQQPGLRVPGDPTGPGVRQALRPFAPIGQLNPLLLNRTTVRDGFGSPYSQQWNVTVQRNLGQRVQAEVAYVGSVTTGILRTVSGNPLVAPIQADFPGLLPAGVTAGANGRLLDGQGFIRERNNDARSNYHALQTRTNVQLRNLTLGATYTYARQRDTSVDVFGGAGGSSVPQDPFNPIQGEWSRGLLDIPHIGTMHFLYDVPGWGSSGFARAFTKGWQLGGTLQAQSGQPYTVSQFNFGSIYADRSFNLSPVGPGGNDGPLRPFRGNANAPVDLIALDDVTARTRFPALNVGPSPTGYYSFVALRQGRVETVEAGSARFIVNTTEEARRRGTPYGDEPRNSLRGGNLLLANLAVFKNTTIGERLTAQFRFEAFNVTNRPSFGIPNARLDDAGAAFANLGELNGGRRQLQFGLKLIF